MQRHDSTHLGSDDGGDAPPTLHVDGVTTDGDAADRAPPPPEEEQHGDVEGDPGAEPRVPEEVARRQPPGAKVNRQTEAELNAVSGRMPIAGMPTKPMPELLAHMREIACLEIAARERARREAAEISRQREQHEAAEKAWLREILPHFSSMRLSERTRELCFEGIPASVRPMVWRAFIGNARCISVERFRQCAAAAEAHAEQHREQQQQLPRGDSFAAGGTEAVGLLQADDIARGGVDLPRMAPNTRLARVARQSKASRRQIDVDVPRTHILSTSSPASVSPAQLSVPSGSLTPPPPLLTPRTGEENATTTTPPRLSSHLAGAAPGDDGGMSPAGGDDGGSGDQVQRQPEEEEDTEEVVSPVCVPAVADVAASVTTLLHAFTELQPDVGYVQGMSYLAGMLLLELPLEDAFVAFANLVSTGHFPFFFRMDPRAMSAHLSVFEQGLEKADRELAAVLREVGAVPQLYVVEWWMTLFSRTLPLPLARRCWDAYLGHHIMLYRFSIAVVVSLRPLIMGAPDEALVVLTTLHRFPERVDTRRILDLAFGNALPNGAGLRSANRTMPSLQWLLQIEHVQLQPWRFHFADRPDDIFPAPSESTVC